MVTMTIEKLDTIEDMIEKMSFRVGRNVDTWYPTLNEVKKNIKDYTESDIRFLLWLMHPDGKMTEEQLREKKEIQKLLYNDRHLRIVDDQ